MNSDTITGAASPLTPQFEATRSIDEPSVPEIDEGEELEAEVSDHEETAAGLLRLVEFINNKKTDKNSKIYRQLQAYESAKNFKDNKESGQLLNAFR